MPCTSVVARSWDQGMDIPSGGEEKPVLYIGTSSEEVEDKEHATYVPTKSLLR